MKDELEVLRDCSADCRAKIISAMRIAFEAHDGWEVYGVKITAAEINKYDSGNVFFSFTKDGKPLTHFSLAPFPHCKHILLSLNSFVDKGFRKQGYGRFFNKLRIRAASLGGFSKILATVREDNEAEIAIMKANNWTKISDVRNDDQNITIGLWERLL